MLVFKSFLTPLRCSNNYTQTVAITLIPYSFKILKGVLVMPSFSIRLSLLNQFRSANYS